MHLYVSCSEMPEIELKISIKGGCTDDNNLLLSNSLCLPDIHHGQDRERFEESFGSQETPKLLYGVCQRGKAKDDQ